MDITAGAFALGFGFEFEFRTFLLFLVSGFVWRVGRRLIRPVGMGFVCWVGVFYRVVLCVE